MYSNMKSAISTNGYVSHYFPVSRGIRQGDSLSALLYVIQAEPMSQYIRKSATISGISIEDNIDDETQNVLKCTVHPLFFLPLTQKRKKSIFY